MRVPIDVHERITVPALDARVVQTSPQSPHVSPDPEIERVCYLKHKSCATLNAQNIGSRVPESRPETFESINRFFRESFGISWNVTSS